MMMALLSPIAAKTQRELGGEGKGASGGPWTCFRSFCSGLGRRNWLRTCREAHVASNRWNIRPPRNEGHGTDASVTTVINASKRATAATAIGREYADEMFRDLGQMLGFLLGSIVVIGINVIILRIWLNRKNSHTNGRLVICSTQHTRFFPVRHSFTYPLLYVFFDITENIDTAFFSLDKWRLFSVRTADYLGNPPNCHSLHEKLKWHLERHVHLLCNP